MVQWLRICLPNQATQVQSLVWEDPTCCGASKPLHCKYWSPPCSETREAPLTAIRESWYTATKTPGQPKLNKFLKMIITLKQQVYGVCYMLSIVLFIYINLFNRPVTERGGHSCPLCRDKESLTTFVGWEGEVNIQRESRDAIWTQKRGCSGIRGDQYFPLHSF